MMRRFKILLEYDGTNYCGWQKQKNGYSIQSSLEGALQPLNIGKPVNVIGAGRTDSGVHALGQVAHFDLATSLSAEEVGRALNAETPRDVLILNCEEVDSSFHARYSAIKRTYVYQVLLIPSVIHRYFTWQPGFVFKKDILKECADEVLGEHNFASFCRSVTEANSKNCTVYESIWLGTDQILSYRVAANRFLHNMVRMLVGTMMEVARGRYGIKDFQNLLENKSKVVQVYTAPAKGLFLLKVSYK